MKHKILNILFVLNLNLFGHICNSAHFWFYFFYNFYFTIQPYKYQPKFLATLGAENMRGTLVYLVLDYYY